MDYNKFERNLILLLKIFNNRPNHLSKFLVDNKAFSEDFLKEVIESDKLNAIQDIDLEKMDFSSIEEMNSYYNDLIKDEEQKNTDLQKYFNDKLFKLIQEENYEEAIKVRNYMNKKGIDIKL